MLFLDVRLHLNGEEIKLFDWAGKTHKFWNDSKVTVLEWSPPRNGDWMDCSSNYVTMWSESWFWCSLSWFSKKLHMSFRGTFPAHSLLHSLSTMVTQKILIVAPPKDLCYSKDCHLQIHNCLFFTASFSCTYDHKLKMIKKSKWIKICSYSGQLQNTSLIKKAGISHRNSKKEAAKTGKAQLDRYKAILHQLSSYHFSLQSLLNATVFYMVWVNFFQHHQLSSCSSHPIN